MSNYTSKIKGIGDALGSINVMVEEDELVQICFESLAQCYGPLRTVICTWEKLPSFFDLQSMLLVEENHAQVTRSAPLDNQMLYMEAG